jgi:hypothetical protein
MARYREMTRQVAREADDLFAEKFQRQ